MISKLQNQKGSILLNAIITTVIIAILSGFLLQQSLTTLKTLRLPRVKSVMSAAEGSIRHALLQSSSYTSCDSTAGSSSCDFNAAIVTNLNATLDIPGCVPGPCGVRIVPVAGFQDGFDDVNRRYRAQIIYQGTEVAVKPRDLDVEIPQEILQSAAIDCDDSAPIFTGFNAAGVRQCRGLGAACPAGQFLTGFDATTLTPTCVAINTTPRNCGSSNEYINTFQWDGVNFTIGACADRPTPSSQWPL